MLNHRRWASWAPRGKTLRRGTATRATPWERTSEDKAMAMTLPLRWKITEIRRDRILYQSVHSIHYSYLCFALWKELLLAYISLDDLTCFDTVSVSVPLMHKQNHRAYLAQRISHNILQYTSTCVLFTWDVWQWRSDFSASWNLKTRQLASVSQSAIWDRMLTVSIF